METEISFVSLLSLKEIAMRRVVINLWNQPDVLASFENFYKETPDFYNYSDEWREAIEDKVTDKLSKLEVPSDLLKQLLPVVRPIGLKISNWKMFHEKFLKKSYPEKVYVELSAPVLGKLRWTVAGLIDYRQTAEELIRCEMLDTTRTYQLACLYCLEDCIPSLWKKLPKKVKTKYTETEIFSKDRSKDLPHIWSYIVRGEEAKLDNLILCKYLSSFNHSVSLFSACNGNRYAMEYFFQNSPDSEKSVSDITDGAILAMSYKSNVLKEFPPENLGNVFCYLLSLMSYDEQMEIIRKHPVAVLTCLLEWPWHDVFSKIANLVWDSFTEEQHRDLIYSMHVFYDYSNYSNPSFFQECYTRSPSDFKKYFFESECTFGRCFRIFFDNQDSETIAVVLRNSDLADRARLASSRKIVKLFYRFISKERYQTVEMFLREARLSEEDKERAKEAFKKFNSGLGGGKEIEKNKVWVKFLQILHPKNEELGKGDSKQG